MKPESKLLAVLAASLCSSSVLAALPGERSTERVSLTSTGVAPTFRSNFPSCSGDGSVVAFESSADDIVPGDTNFSRDIFVRDRNAGTTTRVSVSSSGAQADHHSYNPSISADGRYVVFHSKASNLVSGDTNAFLDAFLHDRTTGQTTRISVGPLGAQADGQSYDPVITPNGSHVAFWSGADNLVANDTNPEHDVFVRDLATGTNTLVSVSSSGVQSDANSSSPAFSADGQIVTFDSLATNLVAGDTNGAQDVFVHVLATGETTRVSVSSAGTQGNSFSRIPRISGDGRYVTFESRANTLVPNDNNASDDIFLHDLMTGLTSIVSVHSNGTYGAAASGFPSISSDGRRIAFFSWSSNLVDDDLNSRIDIFVHDTPTQTTRRVSVDSIGIEGNGHSIDPDISPDGRFVAFQSGADNLISGDTNGYEDIFVHDSLGAAAVSTRQASPNPMSYTANAPVLGMSWTPSVDLTTTGHTSALILGFSAPVQVVLGGGQVLLVAGAYSFDLPVQPGPLASWSVPVANNPSLAGATIYTQALHLFGVVPFALSNAQDVCLGY